MSHFDDRGLSQAQAAAVLDDSPRVLVAAGAGSGKTSLLVAYFVRALLDEGVPVERLVAVTFTRKAAGELAHRIRADLECRGRIDLARSLDAGTIGTIHSLCRRILRRNALQSGVDPSFTVLEADAAQLLKREAADQVWEEAIQEADEALLAILARHEKTLRSELVTVYDRLRAVGYEAPQIDLDPLAPIALAGAGFAGAVRSAIDALSALPRRTVTAERTLDLLRESLDWAASIDPDRLTPADVAAGSQFFPTRKAPLQDYLGPVRQALTSYRCHLAAILLAPLVEAMNALLSRLHERYTLLKQTRGALDFADLELRTDAFLRAAGPTCPPIFGEHSRVMIDEFQDTNELQCGILESLQAFRLLMVGDARQSIYRFRGADVDVFERRLEVGAADQSDCESDGGQACHLHHLDRNYRSCAEVLDFVNHLFSYDDFFGGGFVALECGIDRADAGSAGGFGGEGAATPGVEVLTVHRSRLDVDAPRPLIQEAEAQASAWSVERLITEEGLEPRDVVILSPALTYADLYQEALRARRIPAYVVRGKGYYSREEVADIRCLLRLLVNPHDDLALVTVLRSPFVGLSDDGLFLLGREAQRTGAPSLWQVIARSRPAGLPEEDEPLLEGLRTRLASLRKRVGRPGLAALMDEAMTISGYDLRMLAAVEGKRCFANIRKLMRVADEFESLHGPDVAAFVDLLGTLEDVSEQEGNAATLAEEENVVRVMTVHQAKGLEFPAVVVTGLGSDVRGGRHGSFVVDNRGEVGVFLRGSCQRTYEHQDLCWGPAVEIVKNEEEKDRREDVRLLYVAMTRAKQRLILVGACPEKGGTDRSRLVRIGAALGLESPPAPGQRVEVPHASVRGVAYDEVAVVAGADGPLPAERGPEHSPPFGFPLMPDDDMIPARLQRAPASLPSALDRVSFSALSLYLDCPRRFYLERVLRLDLDDDDPAARLDEGPDADDGAEAPLDLAEAGSGRDVGLLVHALLERSDLCAPQPSPESLHALAVGLLDPIRLGADGRSGRLPGAGRALSPEQRERAVSLARSFWSSPVARRGGLKNVVKEAPFSFLAGDLLVSGVMDLVWEEAGCVYIVDYKTNLLKGRTPQEAASTYRLQAALYALAALKAGALAVQMDLLFLEQADDPVSFSCTEEDVSRLEQLLEKELEPLRSGLYPAREGDSCRSCGLAVVCARLG